MHLFNKQYEWFLYYFLLFHNTHYIAIWIMLHIIIFTIELNDEQVELVQNLYS